MSRRVRRRLRLLRSAGVGTGRGDAALARWRGRTGVAGVAALACLAAGAAGGPVAAAVAGVYTALICAAWLSRRQASRIGRDRLALVDAIAMLGADLRAGLAPAAALAEAQPALHAESGVDGQRERSLRRFEAAWRLSGQLGAPLADLLDRVEYDLRAAERVRTAVAAQTAGAWTTTWVLAALPAAGTGLGYAMGVDPIRSLLHTPLGAGCTAAALILQCAGLAWVSWLVRSATAEALT
jgi:tight adherence protein B